MSFCNLRKLPTHATLPFEVDLPIYRANSTFRLPPSPPAILAGLRRRYNSWTNLLSLSAFPFAFSSISPRNCIHLSFASHRHTTRSQFTPQYFQSNHRSIQLSALAKMGVASAILLVLITVICMSLPPTNGVSSHARRRWSGSSYAGRLERSLTRKNCSPSGGRVCRFWLRSRSFHQHLPDTAWVSKKKTLLSLGLRRHVAAPRARAKTNVHRPIIAATSRATCTPSTSSTSTTTAGNRPERAGSAPRVRRVSTARGFRMEEMATEQSSSPPTRYLQ